MGQESFRVLRVYMGLKEIKCSALGDFSQHSKLLLFNYFQDLKAAKLNIRLMFWPRLDLLVLLSLIAIIIYGNNFSVL